MLQKKTGTVTTTDNSERGSHNSEKWGLATRWSGTETGTRSSTMTTFQNVNLEVTNRDPFSGNKTLPSDLNSGLAGLYTNCHPIVEQQIQKQNRTAHYTALSPCLPKPTQSTPGIGVHPWRLRMPFPKHKCRLRHRPHVSTPQQREQSKQRTKMPNMPGNK